MKTEVDADHRALGVALYNSSWTLLAKSDRTAEEDDELLHQAHASAYHWTAAPECEPKNRARSEWLCSRVYSVLGRAEPALHHAERCLAYAEGYPSEMEDWDLPYAYEALARASLVAGDPEAASRHEAEARRLGEAVADEDDRELLLGDLDRLGDGSPPR